MFSPQSILFVWAKTRLILLAIRFTSSESKRKGLLSFFRLQVDNPLLRRLFAVKMRPCPPPFPLQSRSSAPPLFFFSFVAREREEKSISFFFSLPPSVPPLWCFPFRPSSNKFEDRFASFPFLLLALSLALSPKRKHLPASASFEGGNRKACRSAPFFSKATDQLVSTFF